MLNKICQQINIYLAVTDELCRLLYNSYFAELKMVQRITYRRRLSYNTRSNRVKTVRTPGGKLVFQYLKKRPSVPKCPMTGVKLKGVKPAT